MIWRAFNRVCVCWWRGHRAWPEGVEDPFCQRCGKVLGDRPVLAELPPEKESLDEL